MIRYVLLFSCLSYTQLRLTSGLVQIQLCRPTSQLPREPTHQMSKPAPTAPQVSISCANLTPPASRSLASAGLTGTDKWVSTNQMGIAPGVCSGSGATD